MGRKILHRSRSGHAPIGGRPDRRAGQDFSRFLLLKDGGTAGIELIDASGCDPRV